ncbi:MAG: hypothetical protein RMI94_05340 [Bryobacterales bacterium]|nr:hypothetical protein [Bryobacteraceae bacterium]MDW8129953.1 hypothetical protein [Bryobacterales bacterium]
MTSAAGHRRRTWALALLPALMAAQTAVLEVRVLEGEGTVQRAGERVRKPWTVQVVDETGQPVPDATVTFRLPAQGPTGAFPNGLQTEVTRTGPDGRATVREVRWNRIPGPVRVRVIVVKNGERAGAVFEQQLVASSMPEGTRGAVLRPGSRWWKVGAVAAGATAAGLAAMWLARDARATPSNVPQVRIGPPVIAVGRP